MILSGDSAREPDDPVAILDQAVGELTFQSGQLVIWEAVTVIGVDQDRFDWLNDGP